MSRDDQRPQARAIARAKLRARRQRVGRIRRATALASLVVFAAFFSLIVIQMITGHDPALADRSAKTVSTRVTKRAAPASQTQGARGSQAQSTGSATQAAASKGSSTAGTQPTPVVTAQS